MTKYKTIMTAALFAAASATFGMHESDAKYDASDVPGNVVAHSPAESGKYLGSPSLCVLPDGTYVVSHDFFGKAADCMRNAHTHVYESKDKGKTWEKIAEFQQFWGGLFYNNGALYIMSVLNEYDSLIIRKSTDGGHTWTEPKDANSGLLKAAEYHNPPAKDILDDKTGFHTSSNAVLFSKGRIWRAMETAFNKKWGVFGAFIMSADQNSDLLKAESWTYTNVIPFPKEMNSYAHFTWLEGNAVEDPKGDIYDMLRVQGACDNVAFLLKVSHDGTKLEFNPKRAANIEGSSKKFIPRYDPVSKKYWSLVNWVPEKFRGHKNMPASIRNTLALTSSSDLKKWEVVSVLLQREDVIHDGFQYVDWLFDGDDIIFACRTALYDGISKAHNNHDSNFITFHRIENFRERDMNSPLLK